VAETVREVAGADGFRAGDVAAMGCTGQGDGTWLVDREGSPVRPAIIWLDGRAGEQLRRLQEGDAERRIVEITGTALNLCNQGLQIGWLQEHEGGSLRRAHAALRAKDWAFLRLTGQERTDETDASFTYFNIRERKFAEEVFDLLGIRAWRHLVPEAPPSHRNVAPLQAQVAADLGLRAGLPVVAGPFDVVASGLGAGAVRPGDACTVLGTAGIHQMVLDRPDSMPTGIGYTIAHPLADRWVRLLAAMTGTLNLQWFAREFYGAEMGACERAGQNPWEYLEGLARQVEPGCDGVIYHPYIDPAGERAPFVQPAARAQFSGLSARHGRRTMLRAVYEGVALSALDCYSRLPIPVATLKLAGGGARSTLWAQMLADALGCPVEVGEGAEFGAKGAAINAGVATGVYRSFEEGVARTLSAVHRFEPEARNTAMFRSLLTIYRQICSNMHPVWDESERIWSEAARVGDKRHVQ
jgi:erythritol kinase